MAQPQLLTDGQHVPVILEGSHWTAERTTEAHGGLLVDANRLLEWIALDVLDQGKVERNKRHDPTGRAGLRHRVVHLPVLVAHCGGRRAREVEEEITR